MEHPHTQQAIVYTDLELTRQGELKMQLILNIHGSYVPANTELENTEQITQERVNFEDR